MVRLLDKKASTRPDEVISDKTRSHLPSLGPDLGDRRRDGIDSDATVRVAWTTARFGPGDAKEESGSAIQPSSGRRRASIAVLGSYAGTLPRIEVDRQRGRSGASATRAERTRWSESRQRTAARLGCVVAARSVFAIAADRGCALAIREDAGGMLRPGLRAGIGD
jgi:hypothetical protein